MRHAITGPLLPPFGEGLFPSKMMIILYIAGGIWVAILAPLLLLWILGIIGHELEPVFEFIYKYKFMAAPIVCAAGLLLLICGAYSVYWGH